MPDSHDTTAVLRYISELDACSWCGWGGGSPHAPYCAIIAALKADPTAEIARLRADVECLARERDEADAALDKAEATREHLVDARPLTLRERVLLLASDRESERDAAEDAKADAAKLRGVLRGLVRLWNEGGLCLTEVGYIATRADDLGIDVEPTP